MEKAVAHLTDSLDFKKFQLEKSKISFNATLARSERLKTTIGDIELEIKELEQAIKHLNNDGKIKVD